MFNNKERDKMKPKYQVHVWKADDDNTALVYEAPARPTLDQLYKLIGCTTVERQSGYDKGISNRTFDMWCDEESKRKGAEFIKKNIRATNAWYRWMTRTGHVNIPGDFIAGNVVIYKKMKEAI